MIILETSIVEHCNINCAHCARFAPLVKEPYSFLRLADFEQDLIQLNKVLGDKLSLYRIMGGEPTLHGDFEDFIYIARKCLPKTKITFETNGTMTHLLDKVWQVCKDNNVAPVGNDYYLSTGLKNESKQFFYNKLDLDGNQDPIKQNRLCDNPLLRSSFQNGKIYPCSRPICISHFNNYFGTDLKVTEQDYYDIYQASANAEDILRFVRSPIPFCRYCKNHEQVLVPHSFSKCNIKEWT